MTKIPSAHSPDGQRQNKIVHAAKLTSAARVTKVVDAVISSRDGAGACLSEGRDGTVGGAAVAGEGSGQT